MSEPVTETNQRPSILDRLFRRNNKTASPPPTKEEKIGVPQWITEQEKKLQIGTQKEALKQLQKGPPAPGSIAPSSEGTGKSPFTSAAKEGNLPPKVMSPSGEEAERLARIKKRRETKAEILESSGKMKASLPL